LQFTLIEHFWPINTESDRWDLYVSAELAKKCVYVLTWTWAHLSGLLKKEKKKDLSSYSSGSRAPVPGNPASVGAPPHRLGPRRQGSTTVQQPRPSARVVCAREELVGACTRSGGARLCSGGARRRPRSPGRASPVPTPNSSRWTSPHPRPTPAHVLPRRASTRGRAASRHAHRCYEEPWEVAPELAAPPDAMLTASAKNHGTRSRRQASTCPAPG
jgi:hypothetical protein